MWKGLPETHYFSASGFKILFGMRVLDQDVALYYHKAGGKGRRNFFGGVTYSIRAM